MSSSLEQTYLLHNISVEAALQFAARLWPEYDGTELIIRVLDDWVERVKTESKRETQRADDQAQQRRERILQAAGRYHGAYQSDYLDEVRRGWPQ